jgi:hypothetical protein
MTTPIFLLSLPRSGSTLVQRVLTTDPEVASTPEPWILLPLLTPLEPTMPHSRGWQGTVDAAVRDFVAELPAARDDYMAALKPFAERLYSQAAGPDSRYFLDKSPPYHWIADQIYRLFPEAKFIYLWRNPLGVLASMVETFCGGRWRLDRFRGTIFNGLANLTAAFEQHRDRSLAVRYEDLVGGGATAWEEVAAYLDLELDPEALSSFARRKYVGRLGDPTGVNLYSSLSREPLTKWRQAIGNPIRRRWCERYLEWIGEDRLRLMGYELGSLRDELGGGRNSADDLFSDVFQLGRAATRDLGAKAIKRWDPEALSTWDMLGKPAAKR